MRYLLWSGVTGGNYGNFIFEFDDDVIDFFEDNHMQWQEGAMVYLRRRYPTRPVLQYSCECIAEHTCTVFAEEPGGGVTIISLSISDLE